jgi:hypothetical protein
MPSSEYITDLYSSVALQYTHFYNGVAENPDANRLLAERRLSENTPEFDTATNIDELEDYMVYDSEYKKTVPVSRLMNNRKKLSDDEKRIRRSVLVALRADELINKEELERELAERRLARERRIAEEEERRRRREAMRREVTVRYRRSFMSRYIQSEPIIQDYYTEIKNLLLSYKGVKSRQSFAKESYSLGRRHIAKIDVRGKALYLYLLFDPSTLETKYRAAEVKGDCPTLIKIKSDRKKKYALELIKKLMSELGCVQSEAPDVDYRLPYEDNEALIERGLIRVVLPKGITIDENTVVVKDNFNSIRKKKSENSQSSETEEKTASETKDDSFPEQKNEMNPSDEGKEKI